MTCTHAGIFSSTHHFPEVKFPCLCGAGGGVLPFYPHFPEVKFLCVWWGGGGHFYDSKQAGGGGTMLFPMLNVFRGSIFSHFPLVH